MILFLLVRIRSFILFLIYLCFVCVVRILCIILADLVISWRRLVTRWYTPTSLIGVCISKLGCYHLFEMYLGILCSFSLFIVAFYLCIGNILILLVGHLKDGNFSIRNQRIIDILKMTFIYFLIYLKNPLKPTDLNNK